MVVAPMPRLTKLRVLKSGTAATWESPKAALGCVELRSRADINSKLSRARTSVRINHSDAMRYARQTGPVMAKKIWSQRLELEVDEFTWNPRVDGGQHHDADPGGNNGRDHCRTEGEHA